MRWKTDRANVVVYATLKEPGSAVGAMPLGISILGLQAALRSSVSILDAWYNPSTLNHSDHNSQLATQAQAPIIGSFAFALCLSKRCENFAAVFSRSGLPRKE